MLIFFGFLKETILSSGSCLFTSIYVKFCNFFELRIFFSHLGGLLLKITYF